MDNSEQLADAASIDIAVIGMACRFPGANDTESFWQNLRDGVESIRFFTDQELLERGVSAEALADPHYIKASAEITGVDGFDAAFFGYTPREAAETDPQHRLFLEVAWQALESAGYDASRYAQQIGVYAGCGVNTYLMLNLLASDRMANKQDISALQGLMNGNNKDSMTTTVAYKLNLRGPGITVQTACSTSLAAVHVACRGLLNYETDMALAGGSWVNLLHDKGYYYQPGAILSPDGHCRAFDAKAAGTVIGSGAGIVVLKRLADALADGDTIHAVIKGSAVNNDGSAKAGYTAPSVEGQAEVILAAQAIAGISADTISYVETHGTGTTIGDPIEIAALTEAFRETTEQRGFCAIGSVKTNVGHLDAAAGVAGLIKTVLSLKNEMLPPSLHFEQPNPQIDFNSSPFYVNTRCKAWPVGALPRRAGVSSFGIGGTNVHVIVEQAPTQEPSTSSRDWQLLTISARSSAALEQAVANLRQHLAAHPQLALADVAYTLQLGRKHFAHRAVALCWDHDDAVSLLHSRNSASFLSQGSVDGHHPVTFMFPGQGAQHVGMAQDLYQRELVFKVELDRCLRLLQPYLDYDLHALLLPQNDEERSIAAARLEQTEVTQPALFVIEYALARLWMTWGIQPAAMIGHSIGEYVAACLAGVFTLEDALRLVAMRGSLLQQMESGAMLAVSLPEPELAPYLIEGCNLAAVNGPELCVLSGTVAAIDTIEQNLSERGVFCRRLHVSHAFHSVMTDALLPVFVERVAKLKLNPPAIRFFSNVSGDWITPQQATDAQYWGQHLRATVRFNDSLQQLLNQPDMILLEVGPGETLTKLAQRHPSAQPQQLIVSSLPHSSQVQSIQQHLYRTLGKLWLHGVDIDWIGFYAQERRRRVSLPTYPFERKSYWIEADQQQISQPVAANRPQSRTKHINSIQDWLYVPSWQRTAVDVEKTRMLKQDDRYLIFSNEDAISVALVTALIDQGAHPVVVTAGESFRQANDTEYTINPDRPDDFVQLLGRFDDANIRGWQIFHLWSVSGDKGVQSLKEGISRNFYSVLNLAKALEVTQSATSSGTKITINLITNGMADVTGSETLHPLKSLLIGPCKVMPQEYANLSCRIIDIESQHAVGDIPLRLIRQLIAESQMDSDDTLVGYRGPHRWIQNYLPVDKLATMKQRFKQEGVYFITGGLGGIGLTLARYLAQNYRAKLVLLGRTDLPERAVWQDGLTDEMNPSLRLKITAIQQLEAIGAKVLPLQADVADTRQLQAAAVTARAYFGRIDGVIHAAGEVSSGLMTTKTDETIARVLAPKVQGMQALQAAFCDEALDFMVLCSSLATIAGGLSKIDYCAANAYLDASAQVAYREGRYPVISINWDSWREVGMAADMDMPEGIGIAPGEGAELFELIVNGPDIPQIIVSTSDLSERLRQSPHDLLTQPLALIPSEKTKSNRFPRPALQTPFNPPANDLESKIAEIWQSLLGIDTVGIDDNLFELGGDSLLGVQLLARVRTGFAIDLHPADFFRSPTIASLAALVETRLLDEIECS
ncbi:Acyl transferase domain-containing protein [Nitrosomonas sp. PY1]|uniref:type I polyketide synthase n=1 Tax=Nitrosomonas sp. PY1 TaxID=1803906 RepID=UPI001FC8DA20|nr:type I polyketide synthase [Nitrosomonas sp. PY1]GKS69672.1 Acyl transferase domain-containing protein [Nitrosomonas sp. PY1]